jgi:hypothetical protein
MSNELNILLACGSDHAYKARLACLSGPVHVLYRFGVHQRNPCCGDVLFDEVVLHFGVMSDESAS